MQLKLRKNIGSWSISSGNYRTIALDLLLVGSFYGITSLSHLLAFPLYQFDPIKLFLLIMIAKSSRTNALVMALSLPLFATLTTGHPVFPKNLAMVVELVLFTGLLTEPRLKQLGKPVKFFIALTLSRLGYYLCKAGLIWTGLLQTRLFSTSLAAQVMSVLILFLLFLIMNRSQEEQL